MDQAEREQLRAEVEQLVASKPKRPKWEALAEAAGSRLRERIEEATRFLDVEYGSQNVKFGARLACVASGTWEIPVCKTPGCGKKLDVSHQKLSHPMPKHSCSKCAGRDVETDLQRKKTKEERYGYGGWSNPEKAKQTIARDPEFWKKRNLKTRATKLARHGSETYANVAAMKQTKLERYGDPDYANSEKAKQTWEAKPEAEKQATVAKRLATMQKRAEADQEFKARIQAKSIATRKKNHGEDYTGREKAKKTCLERYGAENPWQAEDVKEAMRNQCLTKHGTAYYSSTAECRAKVAAAWRDTAARLISLQMPGKKR